MSASTAGAPRANPLSDLIATCVERALGLWHIAYADAARRSQPPSFASRPH